MPSYSTTNLNTRVFAPHVILQQDTSRLAISITTGDGFPATGVTLGDVIRYDVATSGYTLSIASSEEKSEVVGVVESITPTGSTVVVSGSIKYPVYRLQGITSGGDGGVDVLFLSDTLAGGLTGTIDLSQGGEKIVKPVIQVAPHGIYNGIVVNYIGYKTGNQAAAAEQSALLGVGAVMYGLPGSAPGPNWADVSGELTLSATAYPDLYSIYSSTANFIEKVTVTPVGASPSITTTYPQNGLQVWQTSGATRINEGTVVGRDTSTGSILVEKPAGTELMSSAKSVIINGNAYTLVSSQVHQFIVPQITSTGAPTQNGQTFVPYIKLYESTSVSVPDSLTIQSLTVSGNVAVGSVTDLEAKLADIDNKLALINARVQAY